MGILSVSVVVCGCSVNKKSGSNLMPHEKGHLNADWVSTKSTHFLSSLDAITTNTLLPYTTKICSGLAANTSITTIDIFALQFSLSIGIAPLLLQPLPVPLLSLPQLNTMSTQPQKYFNIAENICQKWIMLKLSTAWRAWKVTLKKKHYDIYETDEERLSHVPSRLDSAQWMWLVEFWGSKEGKACSKRNAAMHKKQQTENPEGEEIDRINMFKLTHTRKNGQLVDDASSAASVIKTPEAEKVERQHLRRGCILKKLEIAVNYCGSRGARGDPTEVK
ncbi:hypothetical protein CK203_089444 [Vitis vinifera]|uniref:Uncharacterized protein n=1 Tax=Vitis vinifera TaxID=29760 RepID=A0A438E8Y5_VITVI|nr:hypothetical protein CK203_089444 [Vitis vinifera]